MKAERYFNKLIYADQQINADLDELERIKTTMGSISAPVLDGGIKGKGGHSSRVENIVTKFVDLQKQINEEIDELVDLKREAWDILRQLENPQQRVVLQEYYISCRSVESIAASMFLSYRRVQAIKHEALEAAQKILDKKQSQRITS